MTHVVWQIATDTPDYEADDLTGAGAEASGGRWNERGVAMLYAAETIALACLETVVHLNAGGRPFNRFLVAVEIDDRVWCSAQRATVEGLKVGWDAQPAGRASIAMGTAWARAAKSAVLVVPSAIVPEEANILINPRHPEAEKIMSRKVRRWLYDPRLSKPAPQARF